MQSAKSCEKLCKAWSCRHLELLTPAHRTHTRGEPMSTWSGAHRASFGNLSFPNVTILGTCSMSGGLQVSLDGVLHGAHVAS